MNPSEHIKIINGHVGAIYKELFKIEQEGHLEHHPDRQDSCPSLWAHFNDVKASLNKAREAYLQEITNGERDNN